MVELKGVCEVERRRQEVHKVKEELSAVKRVINQQGLLGKGIPCDHENLRYHYSVYTKYHAWAQFRVSFKRMLL